jgi:uracil-DNA glycosylase
MCYYSNLMGFVSVSLEDTFNQLIQEAARCRLCDRMCERQAVLSELNGSLKPLVMFIAEAPGRLGGDRTRVPLTGDLSGRNFEYFLSSTGLSRLQIFITNAVLCNPREGGRNARPKAVEIANCRQFLTRQIRILQPPLVATLGQVALAALAAIEPHKILLARDVGKGFDWHGRKLVPLYHPSPHVVNTRRRREQQVGDYQAIADILRDLGKGIVKGTGYVG